MNRSFVLCILIGLAVIVPMSSDAAAERATPSTQACCGYWLAKSQPDAEKHYSMSNVFRGYVCVEYDRQMSEYFYKATGAPRSQRVDLVCRGKRDEAENLRRSSIRTQGEPSTTWSVPDVPNLK